MSWEVRQADCVEAMRDMGEASIDAIVTDPPYGLEFMGKEWDALGKGWNDRAQASQTGQDKGDFSWFGGNVRPRYGTDSHAMQSWHQAWATEALRVLKPGGHLLAAGGSRTYHRLTCAIEDAGFEIRDCITHHYGSGFPKSLDVSKAIDKAAGAEREVVGTKRGVVAAPETGRTDMPGKATGLPQVSVAVPITAPATPEAQRWQGFGTALKPATEFWVLARKPLVGSVAANVLEHGVGALNVDGCRVNPGERVPGGGGLVGGADSRHEGWQRESHLEGNSTEPHTAGRWPSNLVLSHAEGCTDTTCESSCPIAELDGQSGERKAGTAIEPRGKQMERSIYGATGTLGRECGYGDTGGASRFFPTFRYVPKSSRRERNLGLPEGERSTHPTVKPLALMRWLVRLVTPPNGLVLDPFAGSGSTGCAAVLENFDFIGIEREPEYVEIAKARIAYWSDPKAHEARVAEAKRLEDEASAIEEGRPVQLSLGEQAA